LWRWTCGIALFFLAAALLYPAALKPFNRLWLKFGLLLHKVANPIMMAFVFFGAVLPTGLIMRVRKKFWLLPILFMMVVFGGLVVLTKGSAVAPFIYTLF
jgi:hypothetical protein